MLIGIISAKGILQVGGPAPAPPTPLPVIRVVLLHTEPAVLDLCPGTVYQAPFVFVGFCFNLYSGTGIIFRLFSFCIDAHVLITGFLLAFAFHDIS